MHYQTARGARLTISYGCMSVGYFTKPNKAATNRNKWTVEKGSYSRLSLSLVTMTDLSTSANTLLGILYGYPSSIYLPFNIVAGDTTVWNTDFTGIQPNGTVTMDFYMAGPGVFHVSGVPSTSGSMVWTFTIPAAQSQNIPEGIYAYSYKAGDGNGNPTTIQSGRFNVKANVATANPGDFQTFAQKRVCAIENAILAKLSDDVLDYSYYGKSVKTIPLELLEKDLAKARWEVWHEQNQGIITKQILTWHTGN